MNNLLQSPIFFEKNRVWRVYTGGALFAEFFGDDSTDGYEPEEWVASAVKARNKISKGEKEGVSRIRGTDLYFDDLLKQYPKELLGDRTDFDVLIKFLDSAIRLPVQAHPDKAFSRKYFHSDYGKTESWVVLATREDACLYVGFKEHMTKEAFAEAVAQSEQDKDAMERLMYRVNVKPGDVFLIPALLVHAIGKGCLILEIQEPTDFTIQPEAWCGEYHLNDDEMYIGLAPEDALDCFDYDAVGSEIMDKVKCVPQILHETGCCLEEELIGYKDTPCFAVQRYTLIQGEAVLTQAPAVYVVTDGKGQIICNGNRWDLKKGDYFFLPYAAKDQAVLRTDDRLQAVLCLPPER